MTDDTKKITYSAKGFVYGKYWGGGRGAYAAEPLKDFDTEEELTAKAEEMLKDGSLDSGMGYEELLGAHLTITKLTTIKIGDDTFCNETYGHVFIGDLTEEETDFLSGLSFNY